LRSWLRACRSSSSFQGIASIRTPAAVIREGPEAAAKAARGQDIHHFTLADRSAVRRIKQRSGALSSAAAHSMVAAASGTSAPAHITKRHGVIWQEWAKPSVMLLTTIWIAPRRQRLTSLERW
jgi:hypothetical protein